MDPNNPLNPQPQNPAPVAPTDPLSVPPQAPQVPPPAMPTPTWPLPPVQTEAPALAPATPAWSTPVAPSATFVPQPPAPAVAPDISQFQPAPVAPVPAQPEPATPSYTPSTPVPDNTFTPVPPPTDSASAMPPSTVASPPPWAAPVVDNAPTDLSQLIGNSPAPVIDSAPSDMPATVSTADVVAQTTSPVSQIVTNEGGKGFPKWMIAAGLGIVLVVAGASAYFILGVGKSQNTATTSIPAEQQPLTTPPRTTNPSPQPTVESTSSATFGDLQGSSPSAQATPSGQTAAEILKQRAAQGR